MILIDARRGSRRVGEKKAAERRQQWQEAKKAAAIAWQGGADSGKKLEQGRRMPVLLPFHHWGERTLRALPRAGGVGTPLPCPFGPLGRVPPPSSLRSKL